MFLSGGTEWREEEEDGWEDTGELDCCITVPGLLALHNHNNPSQSELSVKKGKGWLMLVLNVQTDMPGVITSRRKKKRQDIERSQSKPAAYLVKVILLESWILWGELSRKLCDEYWNNKENSNCIINQHHEHNLFIIPLRSLAQSEELSVTRQLWEVGGFSFVEVWLVDNKQTRRATGHGSRASWSTVISTYYTGFCQLVQDWTKPM